MPTPVDGRGPTIRQIALAIEQFKETGLSTHSTIGVLGSHILNWCVRNKVDFSMTYKAGGGFIIVKGFRNVEKAEIVA